MTKRELGFLAVGACFGCAVTFWWLAFETWKDIHS